MRYIFSVFLLLFLFVGFSGAATLDVVLSDAEKSAITAPLAGDVAGLAADILAVSDNHDILAGEFLALESTVSDDHNILVGEFLTFKNEVSVMAELFVAPVDLAPLDGRVTALESFDDTLPAISQALLTDIPGTTTGDIQLLKIGTTVFVSGTNLAHVSSSGPTFSGIIPIGMRPPATIALDNGVYKVAVTDINVRAEIASDGTIRFYYRQNGASYSQTGTGAFSFSYRVN
jgi:hypothetical protein